MVANLCIQLFSRKLATIFAAILDFSDRAMISADHPRFSCTSDMSLTIHGKIFSGPLVHTNDPSGTVLIIFAWFCFLLSETYQFLYITYLLQCNHINTKAFNSTVPPNAELKLSLLNTMKFIQLKSLQTFGSAKLLLE